MENVILLTVITVVYNAQETIEETIQSVLSQKCDDFEWIIVDGNSTDKTNEIIKNYIYQANIKVTYISESDNGIYDAMNKGIRMASGRYLTFMNADDKYYDESSLKYACDYLKKNGGDIMYGDTCLINGDRQYIVKAKPLYQIKRNMIFCSQSAFVKTELQRKHMFDTNFRICADYDFFLWAYLCKNEFIYCQHIFSSFRLGGVSSANILNAYEEEVEIKIKNKIEKRGSINRKIKYRLFLLMNKMFKNK